MCGIGSRTQKEQAMAGGILGKIFGAARPDPGNSDTNFKDDVYRERRGLLGKLAPYFTPKNKLGPPPGRR